MKLIFHRCLHWFGAVSCLVFLANPATSQDITYTYDALGRLVEADYNSANKVDQYCYDKLGNRLERIISTSGGTCGSSGGGGGGPSQLTTPGTLVVVAPHTSVYACGSFWYGVLYEWCYLTSNNVTVFYRTNGGAGVYDPGYSGLLEVTAAAYGTGQP